MQMRVNEHKKTELVPGCSRVQKGVKLYTLINTMPVDLTYVPGHSCFFPLCPPELATF